MNKNGYRLMITLTLLIFGNWVTAQTYSTGSETKKADVNFTELANYYKAHPAAIARKVPFNEAGEDEERPKHRKPHASEVHYLQENDQRNALGSTHRAYLPAAPAPTDTFQSTISAGDIIPPDTHGAVDSQYCVTAINTAIHIQNRSGGSISVVGLDGFWSSIMPVGDEAFDPRVHYDPFYKRWILITDAVDQLSSGLMNSSTILVAVSATNDPTGTWHMYATSVDPTNASWMDFPNVGFNSKWITVTGNMFPNTGAGVGGAVVYVFNYASIMSGSGAPYAKISQSASNSIAPAVTYDPTEPNEYAIENWSSTSGQLRLWEISGAVGSPVMTSVGYPASTQHWKSNPPGGFNGNAAPQIGDTLINIGDDRITKVMYRNHKLWCSFTAFLPATGTATRSSIMWWQIDTLANPLQIGLIDDPTNTNWYAFSSIAVNTNDDALIGFGAFSAVTHPSAGYALHMGTDPVDSISPVTIFRHGQAFYNEKFGSTRNRWGDYSGACIDPRNDTDFWVIEESSIVGTSPNWDTWWASVQFCPKPIGPTLLYSPAALCIGDTGTYKLNPISGATSYIWSVSGTGWTSTSSTVDSIKLTIGSGTGTISVVAYNSCGEGEASTFNITPTTVATKPGIGIVSPACVGSPTATFSATSGGASYYIWQTIGTGWSGTGGGSSVVDTVGTGTGLIICTAYNSCGASAPDTLVEVPAVVPVTTFSIANSATFTNTNDVITFTGTAPGGSSYTWNFGGGTGTPGTGSGPQTVYWITPGTKTVTLTVNNGGCTSTYSDTVNVGETGVGQVNNQALNVNIVPNPNDGTFNIVFNQPVNQSVSVMLVDMQGRSVYKNVFSKMNNNQLLIATNDLPSGIYAASIYIDGNILITKKVTINR